MSDGLSNNPEKDDDTAHGGMAWHRSDDIPCRFDELPSQPDWTPVADVIKTQREETAKQEAQEVKIQPPSDDESESDTESSWNVQRVALPPKTDNIKCKSLNEGSKPKTTNIRDEDAAGGGEDIDAVTQSMMKWALSKDYEMKRRDRNQELEKHYDQPFHTRDPATISKEHPKNALNIPTTHDDEVTNYVKPEGGDDKHKHQGHRDANRRHIYSPHLRTSRFADDYKEKKSQPRHEPDPDYNLDYKEDSQKRGHEYYSESGHYYEQEREYYTQEGYYHEREQEYAKQGSKYHHERERDYYQKQKPHFYVDDRNYHHDQHVDYWNRGKDGQSRSSDSHHRKVDQYQLYHDDYYHQYREGNFESGRTPSGFKNDQQHRSHQEYNLQHDRYQYDSNQYYMGENNPHHPSDYYEYMDREPKQRPYESNQYRERDDEVLY